MAATVLHNFHNDYSYHTCICTQCLLETVSVVVQTLESYCSKYKEDGEEFKTLINGTLPDGWADELPTFTPEDKGIATRLHSQTMLNALAPIIPGFWGGSAGESCIH